MNKLHLKLVFFVLNWACCFGMFSKGIGFAASEVVDSRYLDNAWRSVYECRSEAALWLSGTTQFDEWMGTPDHGVFSLNEKYLSAGRAQIALVPSVYDALHGPESIARITQLNEVLAELKSGKIRSHRALRNRLEMLGSWTKPPRPNYVLPPPAGTLWGSIVLRSRSFWPEVIGHLDYCFPNAKAAQKTHPANQPRRVVVVFPYDGETGASFAHFRNLAWDSNLPVIGFRVPQNIKDAELTKLWPQLMAAALPEIHRLARDHHFRVEAITVVGYCAGADRAKQLVGEWGDLIDSGVLINLHQIEDLLSKHPGKTWLTINVVGEGVSEFPEIADYNTLNSHYAPSLWVAPDFRHQELYTSRWNYLDTREQQMLAHNYINALPKNARIPSSFPDVKLSIPAWAPEGYVPLAVKEYGSKEWLEKAANATNFQPVPLGDNAPTRAVYVCPPVPPHGIVVCVPPSQTMRNDAWPLELCWWRSKGWLPIIAPAASKETLSAISDWIELQAAWKTLPRYLVLYEDLHQKSDVGAAGAVWQQALTLASANRFRALGWVSSDVTLYEKPELLAHWQGPGGITPGLNSPEPGIFEVWLTDGIIRPEHKLGHKPGTGGKPVVVLPLDEPAHLLPNPGAARLALARVFLRDVQWWREFTPNPALSPVAGGSDINAASLLSSASATSAATP